MTAKIKKAGEPPSHLDVQAWADVIRTCRLDHFRLEVIVFAIQSIGPDGNQRVRGALTGYISEAMLRIMSGKVRKTYKDGGQEIIWRTHDNLIAAMLTPGSADGRALCETFKATVELRLIDSVRDEAKYHSRHKPQTVQSTDDQDNGFSQIDAPDYQPADYAEQIAHVESVLKKILDPRKRQAFRLHMEGVPFDIGKGTKSIAQELGISSKTAGEWVNDIKALLKAHVGEPHDRT